jgi:cation:H+ antiporter
MCAAVILIAGWYVAKLADLISERCGFSKGIAGLLLLAATASLSQLVACLSAATVDNLPAMAVSTPIGSSMFNMMVIGLLDFFSQDHPASYRLNQGQLLSAGFGIILVGLAAIDILFGKNLPAITLLHSMDPITILFIPIYLFALSLTLRLEESKKQQSLEEAMEHSQKKAPLPVLILLFMGCAAAIVAASYFLPDLAERIAQQSGWGESFIGGTMVAITTCLPEMAVAFSAARQGHFDMAVASLLGSNLCYIVILAITDFCYLKAPLLRSAPPITALSALAAMISMAIVVVALTYRAKKKLVFIAGDAVALILVYVFANFLLFTNH